MDYFIDASRRITMSLSHQFLRVPMAVVAVIAGSLVLTACGTATPATTSTSTTTTTTVVSPTTTTSTTTTTTTTVTPTTTTTLAATFFWAATPISSSLATFMTGRSWHAGCPVGFDHLRDVHVSFLNFSRHREVGELIVNRDAVPAVVAAFRWMYEHGALVRQMRLVDYLNGDDERSMRADNTSAFNCRLVPGTTVWSQHSFGRAVDVNPLENPEIQHGVIDPPTARRFADRSQQLVGMIHRGDVVWTAFARVKWTWGGQWHSLKDYQHFSANGL